MLIDKELIILNIEETKIDVIRIMATFALKADKLLSLNSFIEALYIKTRRSIRES